MNPGTRQGIAKLVTVEAGLAATLSGTPHAPSSSSRSRVDLAGTWERHVHGKLLDVIPVPSSQRPLGFYHLQREFLLPALAGRERAIVHFEAITYHGRVSVNGAELGTMGPYVPYEFDISAQAKEGKNHIDVAIADLTPDPTGAGKDEIALGINPGWEAYGGIIRDVYVEIRPASFIDNVRLGYQLTGGYTQASCQARVFISSSVAAAGRLEVVLWKGESEVARAERSVDLPAGATEAEVSFTVVAPDLWSPQEPNLYELRARLQTEQGEDTWKCRTGFRDVAIRGNRFELNGQRLVLNGVCRHDMWKDQGFTLTRAQMAQDMHMIKALGANFVRLVHYPHHRHIVELADQLGLLVTEEPGYWNMDFRTMPRTMIELGYRIMEGTIRRDGNSPSVFAWLLGNECTLTVEYLKEGREHCRKLDPISRPVSFANSMGPKEAKPIFEQAGMDFFDAHVYPADPGEYASTAQYYGDSRPLTFSEWGWESVGDKDIFPETHSELILNLVKADKLAGHSFWSWQDMRQYSRIDWPTADGVLMSGIVTEAREVRPDWSMELSALFQGRPVESTPGGPRPTLVPLKWAPAQPGKNFSIVDLQVLVESAEGTKAWAALEARLAEYWPKVVMAEDQWKRTGERFTLWQESDLLIAGVPFRIPVVGGYVRPLVLTPDRPVTIPVDLECEWLHILGQVTFPAGYPVLGKWGETIATYHLRYSGGGERQIPVRNGIEVAQANLINAATRIEPIATEAQPALKYVKDVVREQYQVLLWTVPLERGNLETLRCEMPEGAPPLAIFAITGER
jgi:beta-glucuronidase